MVRNLQVADQSRHSSLMPPVDFVARLVLQFWLRR